jgi:phosphoglucomutase
LRSREMDRKELISKAREYIQQEKHDFFRQEMENLLEAQNWDELSDRFYTQLAFGTGGLRGVIGGGYNRMNPLMVRRATQGLAYYIKENSGSEKPSAAIAYDSRRFSKDFAETAARTLCANGIKTYLFSSLRPTPELSFAVRRLGCTSGIVITASHNPKEYNGYKVYWDDGGQIIEPHDQGIIEEVRSVEGDVPDMELEQAKDAGLLVMLEKEMDDAFAELVKSYSFRPKLMQERGKELKVVFTPLHGTATMMVERVLGEAGIRVVTVPEQREPDGEFPTVEFPNPEEASAMKMALDLAKKEKADLVMGTDPDCDRLGIAVPDESGEYILINGNQLGCLLEDYILLSHTEAGTMPPRPRVVKTIVTTELQRLIAESYGAETYDVLTGFKYIADLMKKFEFTDEDYVFGGEESYGYLIETEVRDKDAVSAAFLTAEMALYNRSLGRSVLEHLNDIYTRFGLFRESLISAYFKGQKGLSIMGELMERLRKDPPEKIGGNKVTVVKDYLYGTTYHIEEGNSDDNIDLPSSNVLQFFLETGAVVTARPSGTEPKIKFYASCCSAAGVPLDQAEADVAAQLEAIRKELESWIPA